MRRPPPAIVPPAPRPTGRRGLLAAGLLAVPWAGALAAEALEDRLAAIALLLAEAMEAELRRVEAGLAGLAASLDPGPARPGQPPAPTVGALDRAVRAAAGALGTTVIGLDPRLAQIANSDTPPGTPLPASPAGELAADALEALRPVAGRLPGGEAGLALAMPVLRGPGGRPIAVLVALLPPELLARRMAQALEMQGTPPLSARLVAVAEEGGVETIAWGRVGPSPVPLPLPATGAALLGPVVDPAGGPSLLAALRRLGREPGWAVLVAAPAPPPVPAPPAPEPQPVVAAPSLAPLLATVGLGAAGMGAALATLLARRRARIRPVGELPLPSAAELEARQALAELRAICDTIPVGLALLDAGGRVLSANHRLAAFAGLPPDAVLGRPAGDVLPPPLAEAVDAAQAAVMREGRPVLDAPVAVEAPGTLRHTRHLLLSCHPVRDAGGRIEAVSATVQDVTERARAEAGRDLLVRELNHRVKNCLATVQTIAHQTLRHSREDPSGFERAFSERIRALARAHDLLTAHAWGEAELLAVARAALAPWLDDPRLEVAAGGAVMLRPAQAQALVLAFNELATNAAKHGSLTREAGRVRIWWDSEPEGMVRLCWVESGGPPVTPAPARRGFGTRLLEQALRHDLGSGARPEMVFDPAGLRVTISFRPGLVHPAAVAMA